MKLLSLLKQAQQTFHPLKENIALPIEPKKKWVHLSTEENYKLVLPPNSLDLEKGEPAFMCTVIKDANSDEVRLIPYFNVPLKIIVNQEISITTRQGRIEKSWRPDLIEN